MKEEITDEQLIAWMEGEQNSELEKQLTTDVALQQRVAELKEVLCAINNAREVEVPKHMQSNFEVAIARELNKKNQNPSWMLAAAAVALLIIGFGAGKLSTTDSTSELAALKEEIQSLKDVTLTSALQQHSASERILAVNQIEEQERVNEALISTLFSTLNADESPNVRYAALQALGKYMGEQDVRAKLVRSLEMQTDPLIQISLITILVQAEEKSAISPLKEIIKRKEVSPEVKQQASIAIQVLT